MSAPIDAMKPSAAVAATAVAATALPPLAGIARRISPEQALQQAFSRETVELLTERPAAPARWSLWIVAAISAAAIAWSYYAVVDVVTVGEGKVIPASQVQMVQNLEGGIVAAIPVKLGQQVAAGDVLMRIDETRFKASYQESRVKDDALRARIARLSAESAGTPFAPSADLLRAGAALLGQERALYDARRQELGSTMAVLQRQIEQRQRELGERKAREVQIRQSHGLVVRELEMTRPLLRQGVVSEVEVLRLERQASDLKGELDATMMAIPRLEAAIAETRQRVDEVQAKFRADAARELAQVRAEQSSIAAANSANEDRVTRTLVKSPVAGTVKTIKINTIGGVVQPGVDLFEIVPSESGLVVEAHVKPSDIAFLEVGQDAMVKISAYDFSIYGGFPGRVEHISADTLIPDKPGEKPEPYYRVRVRTAAKASRGETLQILPGMTATVDIKTGKRSVMTYLTKPIVRVAETALRER